MAVDPFALSPFAHDQYQQSPDDFDAVLARGTLNLTQDWLNYQQHSPGTDLFDCLRRYRRSRLAMLGALDVMAGPQWPTRHRHTLHQVSHLADLLIQSAWQASRQFVEQRFGVMTNASGSRAQLKVFALGKLGGHELNFSSDVDLVFVHTADHATQQSCGAGRSLDANRYFERQARHLIQLLDLTTACGQVYRVDTRLRPFGAAGPLVCSHDALLTYLETEGREWERLAWLRARLVAGDLTSKTDPTLAGLQPFIYRRHLDFAVFERLRDIKHQIIRQQRTDQDNLKLGIGGIREIEFIVQALQLAFGGRDARLRGNDLWQSLHALGQAGHLHQQETQQLAAAWLFLRRLENLSQFVHDQQTHHLPTSMEERHQLALAFNLADEAQLLASLQQHRQTVHGIFQRLFDQPDGGTKKSRHLPVAWYDTIRQARLPQSHKERMIHILDQATPPEAVGQRLLELLLAIGPRESYLMMLQRDTLLLEKLVRLLAHPALARQLSQHPFLLETLFESEPAATTVSDCHQRWQFFCQRHQPDDTESRMELARQFKLTQQFLILRDYAEARADAIVTGQRLARLAESLLQIACHEAWQATRERLADATVAESALMLVAYGSLASETMHPHSDLDLVMLVDDNRVDSNDPATARFLQRWTRRLIHWLTASTYHGSLYQLDTRLRPNGNAGLALVSLSSFETYQRNQAWAWEHLALVKSRLVCGLSEQQHRFETLRAEVLGQPREADKLTRELNDLARRMHAQGINHHHARDFKLLGYVLKNASTHPEIIRPRHEPDIITALRQHQLIDTKTAACWLANRRHYLENRLDGD